jgi:3-deoxy-7-phosphoheptulonate synthase
MSHILSYHLKKDIVIIGRIAGQYAKPRSNQYETINNGKNYYEKEKIQVYRGDIVNDFNHEDREPNPNRLLEAYTNSVKTM